VPHDSAAPSSPRALLLALLGLFAAASATAQVRVRHSGTETLIEPIPSAGSVATFYRYNLAAPASSDTGLEVSDLSNLFLHENTSTGALSLVVIHDRARNGTSGEARFAVSGLPFSARLAVRDDMASGGSGFGDDYSPDPVWGSQLTALWRWQGCCTDGMAVDGLDEAAWCLSIDPTFSFGINSWRLVSGPSRDTTSLPDLSATTVLCRDCQDLQCPGVVTVECESMSAAFADLIAEGSSLCDGELISNDRNGSGADASDTYPLGATSVLFTLSDTPGFVTECETLVQVVDTTPPDLDLPEPLLLECPAPGGVPIDDPRIQAWLGTALAVDSCTTATSSHDAPMVFPAGCAPGVTTTVTFEASDEAGNLVSGTSTVTVIDTTPPELSAPAPLVLECDQPGGLPADDPRITAWLASATSADACGNSTISHDAPAFFSSSCPGDPPILVTFTATDDCGLTTTLQSSVAIVDTTPPEILSVAFDGSCLWPPNHRYHCLDDLASQVVANDGCDPAPPAITVIGCSSNQPDDGLGDGHTLADCRLAEDGSAVCLRAERLGNDPAGRIYSVTLAATDACGNVATSTAEVFVPHDQSPHEDCVRAEDGK